jgi:hypothetical protein
LFLVISSHDLACAFERQVKPSGDRLYGLACFAEPTDFGVARNVGRPSHLAFSLSNIDAIANKEFQPQFSHLLEPPAQPRIMDLSGGSLRSYTLKRIPIILKHSLHA